MRDRAAGVAILILACGCGRFGYDSAGDPSTADADVSDASACGTPAVTGAIASFSFDGDATDSIGSADGVEVGSPVYVPGVVGQAIGLDGVDDVVQVPPIVDGDFSVSFWVRTTSSGPGTDTSFWFAGNGIVDAEICGSPVDGDWGVALINGGHVGSSGAGQSIVLVNDDAWHHVTHTRVRSTDNTAQYVDGVLQRIGQGGSIDGSYSEVPWIGVGNNPCSFGAGRYFAGSVDSLQFFDRALSQAEVTALFECSM